MADQFSISLDDVRDAAQRVQGMVLATPCLHSERLERLLGCKIYLKAENLQHIGAFKARGAMNAVLQLDEASAAAGVVTHSSGNHAAALARAATHRGIKAYVVMPENSAATKITAVRAFGVEPVFCKPTAEDRQATASQLQEETGATLVHPFDHPEVMAGQGTVALEMLEQVQGLDAVVAPVGGGGLLSGTLVAIKSQFPNIKVYGAEPAWADDAYRSLRSGSIEKPTRYDTIADGLRTYLGTHTFPIIHSLVDDILLVEESQIRQAMRALCTESKLVAEPSGAVSLAAVMAHTPVFEGRRVGVVISGGNLDMESCRLGME